MTRDDSPPSDREYSAGTEADSPELVVFDFDGTLAEQRGSWGLLYRLFGVEARGNQRTEAYWNDELTFEEWCDGNVADWRSQGVTRDHLQRVAHAVKLTTGAENLLSELNAADIPFGVISSGITDLMSRLNRFEPAFVLSNEIVYDDDAVPVDANANVGPNDKGTILLRICDQRDVDPDETLYVGDSHSDVEAFEVAGTAILFDPDDRIDESAYELVDHIEHERDLRRLIPFIHEGEST